MKKKFILKSQLEEIVGHLMEKTLINYDEIYLDISISQVCEEMVLDVTVRKANTYETIEKKKYTIVPAVEDELDVDDDTIGLALARIDGRYQAAKEMVETNTPKEN